MAARQFILAKWIEKRNNRGWLALALLLIIVALPVCMSVSRVSGLTASDNFNRPNGSLGANWTNMTDGGLKIINQAATGASASTNSGDIRTAETYTSDQYSQVALTAKLPTGGQWIGPSVRSQNGGQDDYVGFYFANYGSPELMIFKRQPGGWTQLAAKSTGALSAGTVLKLTVSGSNLALLKNGTTIIKATDSSLTGGAPGIMSFGSAAVDNWAGGDMAVTSTYMIGGTVSGLSGTVALQNGSDILNVSANGSYQFPTALATGATYNVTVKTNPSGQTCTVANGAGTVASANVTNVNVTCTTVSVPTYSVGGTVSGLSGGSVVLQNNGSNDLTAAANGSFAFTTQLVDGAAYNVTVEASPTGQTCTVANGSGTVASANVTNVSVTCAAITGTSTGGGTATTAATDDFNRVNGPLGANWTDMTDGGLTIANQTAAGPNAGTNSGDMWTGGTFASDQYSAVQLTATLPTDGQWIGPSVRSQNGGQDGYVGFYFANYGSPELMIFKRQSGDWIQLGANSTGVLPAGTTLELTITGGNLALLENGTTVITATDTSLTGGAPGIMAYGNAAVDNWSGGDVAAVPSYTVGGTVSGLSGTLTLLDNGGDALSVAASGAFTFATSVASGAAYNVTIKTNPAGQACTVTNGAGTVGTANITNVAISCVTVPTYTIGGTVSGLSGTVVLEDNGGDDTSLPVNGTFTFATPVASGSGYNVTVKTNPTGQLCTVTNGTGIASANVTNVAVACATAQAGDGTDDFNRADGSLGANWTDESDGGLAITSQAVAGTNANGNSGDVRTAEAYDSNQYSQVQVTATQLTGGQWIGPAVRMQSGGLNGYVGIYYWNNGNPELMLFKRTGTSWTQIGNTYNCGALPAGTTLKLEIVGSTLAFLENGVERIATYDTSYTGGAPGIVAFGTGQVDNWSGGKAGFEVHYLGTDANGVESYDMISANNGYGPQILRVLRPTNPVAGVAHNFVYTLPVQPGADNTTFGDGLDTLRSLNAQNQYNLTVIEPSFGIDPWYADNPVDANEQEETFMATELTPWVNANLATAGTEQSWLIGFSKSGYGGMDLLLKHPNLYTLGGFWDFPADMNSYNQYGDDPAASYGTDTNFQTNYRLTQTFVSQYAAPFQAKNRIWIGSYGLYSYDMVDFDNLLTSLNIQHTTEPPTSMTHSWTSGWVPLALSALHQESLNQ